MQYTNPTQRKVEGLIQLPLATAVISFTIGTVLFLLYMLNKKAITIGDEDSLLIIGFFYVVIAFVINTFILIAMLVFSFMFRPWQMLILQKTALMLINIPVAVIYCYCIFF